MNIPVIDSLVNFISNLGTSADKSTHNQYAFTPLGKAQLEAAYRGDWIARKVVDLPAFDATRAWRDWQADDKQIEFIEAQEKKFGVQVKLMRAMKRARLYGGGALIMGVKQGASTDELIVENVNKDDLTFLHVVSRHEITAGEIERSVLSPFYGEPKYYEVNSQDTGMVRVHPSRVVRLLGNDLPDINLEADGWADPVLQVVDDAVKQAGLAAGGIASLINEAKIDVIKIPGLTTHIATEKYRNNLTTRFAYASTAKSLVNTLILDKEEDWARTTTNFTNMPDLLKVYLLIASGAADIPATRLLGQAPAGLNATGDSDVRNYYDRISSEQKNELTPACTRLDEVLIRSALGSRDENIHYKWGSLWQLDDVQQAEVGLKKAQTIDYYFRNRVMPDAALAKATQNMLVEDGLLPGLEEAIEEAEAEEARLGNTNLTDPNENPVGPRASVSAEEGEDDQNRVPVGDAKPRTLYVRRNVKNGAEIVAWAKKQGFKTTLAAADMHVTIAFSRDPVDWMKMGQAYSYGGTDEDRAKGELVIGAGGPRVVEPLGTEGAIVLFIASSELSWRHEEMCRNGASWDHEEYSPHITITYDAAGVSIDEVEPYRGKIELGPEIFEEVESSSEQRAA